MSVRERYAENLETLAETIAYAGRVVGRMPSRTLADRQARATTYMAILDEWHKARIRWKVAQP